MGTPETTLSGTPAGAPADSPADGPAGSPVGSPVDVLPPPSAPASTVWAVARRHRVPLIAGILLGLLGVAATLSQPLVIGRLIENAGAGRALTGVIALLAALFLADAALSAAQSYLIGRAGENIVRDTRTRLSERVLRADLAHLQGQRMGDVHTRLVADTSLVRVALSHSLAQLVINGLLVVGGIALMAWVDLGLLLITLGCLGAASAVSLWLARRLRVEAVRNREDTGEFGADLQRVLGALTTVKASRAEGRERDRLGGLAERARRSGVRATGYSSLLSPAMNVGLQISLAAVVGAGMARVATGSLSPADLTTFVMYLFYLVSPLVLFFLSIGQFQQGRAAVQRVDELAGLPQEERGEEPPAAGPAAGEAGDGPTGTPGVAVEFRGVHFSHGRGADARPVLRDVSLTVPERGLTAVVGPSGAGKTTLFQLVERFHRPDAGTVFVDGRDISRLPLDELRARVGYVQQDSAAMRGTIRENLVYARPDATREEVTEAVAMAGLEELIERLPRGLDTELGDQGVGLSGGQRQRLCIARALLQKPDVMLLDEATSQLDSDAEQAFRHALRRVARRCAVVAIAHRISTVVDAERIVVMEAGRVRAVGDHGTLMREDALYRRLAEAQLRSGPGEPDGPATTGVDPAPAEALAR
ncbi:ABC transporter ATP-binding protein [Streptomyces calidiresistens]|uniref:ATP-binding cassette domain-containing protein n=1 Tax=Streptomyces calidiresistens TaxID=1485586 RepID=A0A7W3T6R3_9ACTN|nr:ABC transporter ATP-binding protein [Streptomyces calidiresistens]MBB0231974.1 ATP-binding cassette domain-containing protein [Streptomyces calidiresistens]